MSGLSFPSNADSLLSHQDRDIRHDRHRADGESAASTSTAPSGAAASSQLTGPPASLPPQAVAATAPRTMASAASAASTAASAAAVAVSPAAAATATDLAEDVVVGAMTFDDVGKERVGVLPAPAASEVESAAAAAMAAVAAAASRQFLGTDEPGAAAPTSNASGVGGAADASDGAAITQEALPLALPSVGGGGGGEGAPAATGTEMVL